MGMLPFSFLVSLLILHQFPTLFLSYSLILILICCTGTNKENETDERMTMKMKSIGGSGGDLRSSTWRRNRFAGTTEHGHLTASGRSL